VPDAPQAPCRGRRCLIEIVRLTPAARMAFVVAFIAAAAACGTDREPVGGYPGLAIKATCRTGSTEARYSEVDGAYPGERASGDTLEGRFLAGIGELPLPCIDRSAETYRIYQYSGGEFGGFLIVGMSQAVAGSRMWAVVQPYGVHAAKIRRAERVLLGSEWDSISTQISAISFWTQPARLMPEPYREMWRGAWKVKGYSGDRYHSVSRFYLDDRLKPVVSAFLDLARPLLSGAAK
jgi:hypothetical protein